MFIYTPLEDSELLKKYVEKYASGVVLDMGTGTGIQAVAAAKRMDVRRVVAVDINKEAVDYCLQKVHHKKLTFAVSDLFSFFHGKSAHLVFTQNQKIKAKKNNKNKKNSSGKKPIRFDTMIFNPPYLPQHTGEEGTVARALAGGKHGYELLGRFLGDAGAFLKPNGTILIVFSSLTHRDKVDELLVRNGFIWEQLEEMPLFFEKLYCYRVRWNPEVAFVRKKGVEHLAYFSHGKRGTIFTGTFKGIDVAVKLKKRESEAQGSIMNEAFWLKRINKYRIGPRFLFSGRDVVVYEFVPGDFIPDFIEKEKKERIKKVLLSVLRQCFQLDQLHATKEEMHHPYKHILVHKGKATLIDFERMHRTKKPQNVTQFVQYICSLSPLLEKKGIGLDCLELRTLAQDYKHEMGDFRFRKIIAVIK